jgi:hypothetical protein
VKEKMERQPLDPQIFDAKLAKAVSPGAPPPMKMMAARGMLPAPPPTLVKVLYQLSFDDGEEVAAAAVTAAREMPADVLVPALQKDQPAGVLDWFSEVREDDEVLEAIALSKATADETIADMAREADARLCGVIAGNQVRVLRHPAIIENLYQNPNAGMATVDKLVDLARRNDVDLSGLPGLQDALRSKESVFGQIDEDDEEFQQLLDKEAKRAAEEDERYAQLDDDSLTRSEREKLLEELAEKDEEAAEEDEDRDRPLSFQLQNMKISEKIRLATVGSREAIKLLVRDTNKLVHMAAIKSPRLNLNDVRRLSTSKSLPDNVIAYIANNRDWTRHYEVVVNLCNNPKTPLADTMKFLNQLRKNDLKHLMRNRNVPHQVSRQAKNLMRKRQR